MEDYSAERDSYALELADHTLSTSVNQEFNKPCSGFSSTFHAVSDEEQPGPQSSCNEPQENEQSDEPAVLLMKAADENDVEAVVTSAVFELAAHAKTHSRSGSVGMLDIGRRRWDSEADESDLPVDPFNYFCRKSSRNSEDEDGRQYLRRKSSYKGEIDDSNKHFVRRKRNRRDKEETTNEHDEGEPLELSAQCICVVSLDDYLFQGEKVHTFPAVHSLTAVSYI